MDEGDVERVKTLLAGRVMLATRDEQGRTLLHHAAKGTLGRTVRCDIVRMLLDHGADVNAQDAQGAAALHWAARSGTQDMVELLLDSHADLHLRDNQHDTAGYWARKAGHQDVAERLARRGGVE